MDRVPAGWRADMDDREFAIAMLMPLNVTGCAWPPDEVDALLEDHEDDEPVMDSRPMVAYRILRSVMPPLDALESPFLPPRMERVT